MNRSLLILLASVALATVIVVAFSACAAHPGPIVGAGAAAFTAALDQLLASGTVTPEQYTAMHSAFDSLNQAVEAGKGINPTNLGTNALTAGVAGLLAYLQAKRGAVAQVRAERGPPATQDEQIKRLQAKG